VTHILPNLSRTPQRVLPTSHPAGMISGYLDGRLDTFTSKSSRIASLQARGEEDGCCDGGVRSVERVRQGVGGGRARGVSMEGPFLPVRLRLTLKLRPRQRSELVVGP